MYRFAKPDKGYWWEMIQISRFVARTCITGETVSGYWCSYDNGVKDGEDSGKTVLTVIPADGTIAGYLPAPKADADEEKPIELLTLMPDVTLGGLSFSPEEPAQEPEQVPQDLASSLFGVAVQDAPEPEPEPDVTQNVMFTYKSGKVKHELRAGATLVKVGKCYYTQLGRKITAIYTDETCKRTVPEKYYSRLFKVSEDPTLFA